MKKVLCFLFKILLSALLAGCLSGWMISGLSHLKKIPLTLQVKAEHPYPLSVVSARRGSFQNPYVQNEFLTVSEQWRPIEFAIAWNQAEHIRFAFDNPRGTLQFKEVMLNGHPLSLTQDIYSQSRNIRDFTQEDADTVSFRLAGERAYFTVPPEQIFPLINRTALQLWHLFFFILSFMGIGWLYYRYDKQITLFWRKTYPGNIICVWIFLFLYTYTHLLWFSFSEQMHLVFDIPGWLELALQVQAHAWIIALFLLGLAGLFFLRSKCLKILLWLCGTALLLTECIDCVLVQLLNARFSPEQLHDFAPDSWAGIQPFVQSFFSSPAGYYMLGMFAVWLILLVCACLLCPGRRLSKSLFFFGMIALVWYLIPVSVQPKQRQLLYDWPRVYIGLTRAKHNQTDNNRLPPFELTYQCQPGLASRQNVLVILVESLSSYMSAYFSDGKAENWTPQLDKLASQHVSFTNHRATNYTTTQSLFSIFTGIPLLHYRRDVPFFKDTKFYRRSLPYLFRIEGYHTALLSSASLVYSKDQILQRAGFNEISTDTDPFYQGKKRFVFNSVTDDVLYARAEKWIEDYSLKKPYLLFVETTTSHAPFIDPVSGDESLEKTIRYADQALGDFIAHLTEKKLLDNTLVVITGDHRVMWPMEDIQPKLYGNMAEARVPFVLMGSTLEQDVNMVTTHTDLGSSLAYLALSKACFNPYQQNMFIPAETRNSCTFFQSLIFKNQVFVECKKNFAKLCLHKKNTALCEGNLSFREQADVFPFVLWIRDNNRR